MRTIPVRTAESRRFVADVERALALTPILNRLTYADMDQIRALFADLAGHAPNEHFQPIPPFYTDCGRNIRSIEGG